MADSDKGIGGENLLSSATTELADADEVGRRKIEGQWAMLPERWRAVDRGIVYGTQWVLCVIGVLFAIIITVEVLSRYALGFSIYVTNALSRLLLVWFFLLGAGIAMRHGAHVGFELLLSYVSPRARRTIVLIGLVTCMVFSVEMIYAGVAALGPAWRQSEPGLDIPLAWPILSIPVGFALVLYHTAVILWVATRPAPAQRAG
jgi:TRAP-type C4-dicarboxylate transport system permease small subunit